MIYMSINTHDYDNDVRVMTGAFYPGNRIVTDTALRNDCDLCVEVIVESVKVHICVTPEGGKEHIIDCDHRRMTAKLSAICLSADFMTYIRK